MCKCDHIFTNSQWYDLVKAELTRSAGVYIIRIRKEGKPIPEAISYIKDFIEKAKWPPLRKYVLNRVDRLNKIRECPVIYIGAAPTSLQKRYRDLCGRRHTVFFPILALFLADWELDFGIQKSKPEEARELENSLKAQYVQIHGNLPALVKK